MFDPFYPFDWLATQIVTQLLGLSTTSHLGSSLHFLLYDVPKVLTLIDWQNSRNPHSCAGWVSDSVTQQNQAGVGFHVVQPNLKK